MSMASWNRREARAMADALVQLRLPSDERLSTVIQDAATLLYDWPEPSVPVSALRGLLDTWEGRLQIDSVHARRRVLSTCKEDLAALGDQAERQEP
jgi:hypothetical protein